jgi:hypothetical protein
MTALLFPGTRYTNRSPDEPVEPTPLPPMRFRDQLIDKLADLLLAAADVIDLIGESTNSRCVRTGRPEREAEEALRCTDTVHVARTVEAIYEEINRLMLTLTD